jgi:hypothetical protein
MGGSHSHENCQSNREYQAPWRILLRRRKQLNVREQIGWRWMLLLAAGSMDLGVILGPWTKAQYTFWVLS